MAKIGDDVIRPMMRALEDAPVHLRSLKGVVTRLKTKQQRNRGGVNDLDEFKDKPDTRRTNLGGSPFTPDGVIDPVTRDKIIATAKGSRPSPDTYLSPDYIQDHLDKFEGGATRFMTEANLAKYGMGQKDGTAFVMPTAEVEDLLKAVDGDLRKFEEILGLPEGFFDSSDIVRIDISDPAQDGLRVPSGNEAGANDMWIPGGKLPTGVSEAVIDVTESSPPDYTATLMGAS